MTDHYKLYREQQIEIERLSAELEQCQKNLDIVQTIRTAEEAEIARLKDLAEHRLRLYEGAVRRISAMSISGDPALLEVQNTSTATWWEECSRCREEVSALTDGEGGRHMGCGTCGAEWYEGELQTKEDSGK